MSHLVRYPFYESQKKSKKTNPTVFRFIWMHNLGCGGLCIAQVLNIILFSPFSDITLWFAMYCTQSCALARQKHKQNPTKWILHTVNIIITFLPQKHLLHARRVQYSVHHVPITIILTQWCVHLPFQGEVCLDGLEQNQRSLVDIIHAYYKVTCWHLLRNINAWI